MKFELITDSSCNLAEELIEQLGIHILPLTFMSEGQQYQSYLKGETTDLKQFYTMMREGKVFTTSLPSLDAAERLLRELLDEGRDVLYVGFSSGLSGTFQAISLVMSGLAPEYPERRLVAVDTLAASAGQGLLVWNAARMAQGGAGIQEVSAWLEENKLNCAHWFTVDDLKFLMRGGRVSKTSAYAGTLLNIKPVMHVDDEGRLIPVEKVRGRRKSLRRMVDMMEETALQPAGEQVVFITHGDCLDEAEALAREIEERLGVTNFVFNYVDPVIGAHTGPGVVALFFLADRR